MMKGEQGGIEEAGKGFKKGWRKILTKKNKIMIRMKKVAMSIQ